VLGELLARFEGLSGNDDGVITIKVPQPALRAAKRHAQSPMVM
jgi:hypothetical protein